MSHSNLQRSLLLPGGGRENYFGVRPCPLVAKTGKCLDIFVTHFLAAFHDLLYDTLVVSEQ